MMRKSWIIAVVVLAGVGILGFWMYSPHTAPPQAVVVPPAAAPTQLAAPEPTPALPDRTAELPAAPAPVAPPPSETPIPPAQSEQSVDRLALMMSERSVGRVDAPVTVVEYFSLTCGHCAAFHTQTWPQVKRDLVDSGQLRVVFRDFPLDGLALAASAVARSLPPEHYQPFISTLLATQDRWAFARGADPREELFKLAALAGMSRAKFDEALADQTLARAILAARVAGQQEHNVTSTPSFVFGSRTVPGAIPYARFAELVNEAR